MAVLETLPELRVFRLPERGGTPLRAEIGELPSAVRRDEIALIGIGAGNLGVILDLDSKSLFDSALGRGMGFYDRHPFGSMTLKLASTSDTSGNEFAHTVSPDGDFASVRAASPLDREEGNIDLRRANTFYTDLGQAVQERIAAFPQTSGIVRRKIDCIIFHPDHTAQNERFELISHNDQTDRDETVGYANKVVLGTGATQALSAFSAFREDFNSKEIVATAEQILADDGEQMKSMFEKLARLNPEQRKIMLIGESYAFATAFEIVRYNKRRMDAGGEDLLPAGAITILAKNEPRIYAQDRDEAIAIYGEGNLDEGYFSRDDGSYNRLSGIRASAKELFLRIKSGEEDKVQLAIAPESEELWDDPRLNNVPIIIQAFGPRTNVVPIFTSDRRLITELDEHGNMIIGPRGNIITTEGDDIGLFGIGIGYPSQETAPDIALLGGPEEEPQRITANDYRTRYAPKIVAQLGLEDAA